jgi:hypothetical protein
LQVFWVKIAVTAMTPLFIATERFDPSDANWQKYIAWSRLEQLDEVVSLDRSLCPTVLPDIKPEYWNHIVNEDFMLHFFVDLDYLRKETGDIHSKNLLCVFRNPTSPPSSQVPEGFNFVGYDLVDKDSSLSALTNCGGFPHDDASIQPQPGEILFRIRPTALWVRMFWPFLVDRPF